MRRIKGHLGPIRDLVISASLDALNKWVSFAGIFLFSFFFFFLFNFLPGVKRFFQFSSALRHLLSDGCGPTN